MNVGLAKYRLAGTVALLVLWLGVAAPSHAQT